MSFNQVDINSFLIKEIPDKPGIYRFLTKNNDILYIGASSNIRKRILQHLSNLGKNDRMYKAIKRYSNKLEYKCYGTIEKAFEAERVEIWTKQPQYNKKGVRVGSYSYLVIQKKPYQHLACYSNSNYKRIKEDDEFFRFNISSFDLERNFRVLRKLIPFCMPSIKISCWDNLLGLCKNDCRTTRLSDDELGLNELDELFKALSGMNKSLIDKLESQLAKYVDELQFEEARKTLICLDTIKILCSRFCGKGFHRETDEFSFVLKKENKKENHVKIISRIKNQIIWEHEDIFLIPKSSTLESAITNFLNDFYHYSSSAPQKIILNLNLSLKVVKSIETWLKRYYGHTVKIYLGRP